ncbi:MAG: hypothetical protein M3Q30_27450 [Actinomycetota bacterium]|nr:hypothetical protein [Actinomycetota bacterium]
MTRPDGFEGVPRTTGERLLAALGGRSDDLERFSDGVRAVPADMTEVAEEAPAEPENPLTATLRSMLGIAPDPDPLPPAA